MKKSKLYLVALAALGLMTASCSDFLDRHETNDNYVSDGFYRSDKAIYDGLMGVYNQMYMNNISGFYLVPFTVIADHLTPMLLERNSNTTIGAGGTLNPDNALLLNEWANCYRGIARANEVLFGASEYMSNFTPKGMQYLAEVHALRAYYYYILAGLWGDVPFFMAPVTDAEYDTAIPTSRDVIFETLIADLNDWAEYLPWMREQAGRVNRGFAYGMIARMGLFGGSLNLGGKGADFFKAAAAASKKVIDEGGYQLAANYGDLFNTTGQAKADVRGEIFYELPYTATAAVKITHTVPFGQGSRIQAQTSRHTSQMFCDTYECIDGMRIDKSPVYDNAHPSANRDPRFAVNFAMDGDQMTVNNGTVTTQVLSCYDDWTKQLVAGEWKYVLNIDKAGASASWASFCNAGTGLINAKYVHETAENIGASTVDILVMRYPEVLLSYAEAKLELGEFDGTALEAVNKVRRRAGVPEIDNSGCVPGETLDGLSSQDKLRQRIRRERKVELMMEGLHLFDMHRWQTGAIENMYPSYGCPLIEYQYQAGNVYGDWKIVEVKNDEGKVIRTELVFDENGEPIIENPQYSLGLDPTDIPNFKVSTENDINDIPCYDAYKQKLKVRDVNRRWEDRFYLWPYPTEELNRTKNLKNYQNPGYN